jgi:hypothetical protein
MPIEYNPVIGRDVWTAEATFTASSAAASYPAANLATADLSAPCRSVGLPATWTIEFTLPRARPVGLVTLIRHKQSQGGTFRLELYRETALTTRLYDSDTDSDLDGGNVILPRCYSDGALEAEDDNWWTATYRTEELAGKSLCRPIWLRRQYLIQGGRLTLTNPTNPAGVYQMARLDVARGHQFSRSFALGASEGHAPASSVGPADGGKEYGERKQKPRVFNGSFNMLPRAEAMEVLGEMKDVHDIVPERGFVWHPFPKQPELWLRTTMWARNAELPLGSFALPKHNATPLSFREVL